MTRTSLVRLFLSLIIAGVFGLQFIEPAFAWVYPEHRDISVLAVQGLDPARKAVFDNLWKEARRTHEGRLCEQGADAGQGLSPNCIDWAALAAVGGDHSCSSQEMADTVLRSNWILKVAQVGAQLKADLSTIAVLPLESQISGDQRSIEDLQRRLESETARAAHLNALRKADNSLQRADFRYATRADTNRAHFMLARPRSDMSPKEYAELALFCVQLSS